MNVTIRKFEEDDIQKKVEWINDPNNNRFLHYDLPLEIEKTRRWFQNNKDRTDRYDAVIEADGQPCGLIGLLSIDYKNSKAEYYVTMGEQDFKGKGIATEATRLILEYAFNNLNLNRVYLFTETDNTPVQRLYERVGFINEGRLIEDVLSHGKFADRYVYGLCRKDYIGC